MIRNAVKEIFVLIVDILARFARFSFPAEYGPRPKLRMLMGSYEPETTGLFKAAIKPGMTVIDIGAHIGYFTRIAARRVGKNGRVIAFEADNENFQLLEKNTVHYSNVTRVSDAVSDKEGAVSFYHVGGSTGCHTLLKPDGSASKREVRATSIDVYLTRGGISHVDVVKMDIEGGEWKALLGMAKVLAQPHAALFIEYNPEALTRAGIKPEQLLVRLFDAGFTIKALTPVGPREISRAKAAEIAEFLVNTGSINILAEK